MNHLSSISEQTLFEYLINKLEVELDRCSLPITDDTLCYLGHMLNYFAQSDNLFVTELSTRTLPTLALLYRDARETQLASNRNKLLRKLGDSALFMGAWFSEVYRQKGMRRDYFIGMGSAAYDYLADNDTQQASTFAELSANMSTLLSITAKVLLSDSPVSDDEVLAMYQQWLATKDPEFKQKLAQAGIVFVEPRSPH